MRQRWLPVGILTGTLFAVNVVARLIVRLAFDKNEAKQTLVGSIAMIAVGLVLLAATVWWVRRYPMPRVAGDLSLGAVAGCLLSTLVAPYVSGNRPFGTGLDAGFGFFLAQLVLYLGMCLIGALLGGFGVMAAGLDYKSQAWKRYTEEARARPRRVVRR